MKDTMVGLLGLNKDETIKKYGNKQVQNLEKSFDIPPPPMELSTSLKIKDKIPTRKYFSCESLKNTFERVIPYYDKKIEPLISY